MCEWVSGVCELGTFFVFSHSTTAISFNILLVLRIYIYLGYISQEHIYFKVSNYICIHIQSMQFPFITYGMALYMYINDSIIMYTDKTLILRECMYMRASELRKFSHFSDSKTAISFNILLVLQILCRYEWHACRLKCTDKTPKKHYWAGGGQLPPCPPPPPPLATLMLYNTNVDTPCIWANLHGISRANWGSLANHSAINVR